MLAIKNKRTRKPRRGIQLNRKAAGEAGLLRYFAFRQEGNPADLITGVDQAWTFSGATAGISDKEQAELLSANGSYFYSANDDFRLQIANKLTFFCEFDYISDDGSSGFVFGNVSSTTNTYNWGIYRHGANDSLGVYIKTGGTAAFYFTANNFCLNPDRYLVIGVYDGVNVTLYARKGRHGRINFIGSSAKTGNVDTTNLDLCFNRWITASHVRSNYFQAGIANKAWTSDQVQDYANNPYKFFKPEVLYFPTAAGAAPTFQAAWARNANILIGCSQ